MSSLTVRDYHIGWICALEDELTAAMAMLDQEYHIIEGQDQHDHNSYVLGKIHQHNVVIACMPAGVDGVVSAATVAKDMARTFPELRVGLMVGIGGGIPNLPQGVDIRLGDVVVSMPDKTWGGVVQFDHGKLENRGVFTLKGQLNQPPEFLLRTLSQVQARHKMRPNKITDYIAEAIAKNSMLEENGFVRPDTPDQLVCHMCSNYIDVAANCNEWHQQRNPRRSPAPVIHHGIIASGNLVVKNAVLRDQLRDQFSALCVEMEAAGLMNDFPCLVVRGICDYADCHKNDVWHAYAAMTAAAYVKEFLSYVSPAQASQEQPIHEIFGIFNPVQQATHTQARALQAQLRHFQKDEHRRCHQAFKTSNYEEQKNVNPDRVEGTCQWVLTHSQYLKWHKSNNNDLLWISADPGCGKSVLAKSLVDHELRGSSTHSICYFFFKDNQEQDGVSTALCALLHQLLTQQPRLIRHALAIYDPNKSQKVQEDVTQLWHALLAAASDVDARDMTCVLDALDECRPLDRSNLIYMLAQFYKDTEEQPSTSCTARLKFLVTSRPYNDIQHDFHRALRDLPTIRLRGEEKNDQIHREIDLVIQMRVAKLTEDLGLRHEVAEQLKYELLQMDHRTYLWLHLAIENIYTTYQNSFAPEEESIRLLPKTVEDAYSKILNHIHVNQRNNVQKILQIIVGSRRPLTVAEMAIALGITYRRSALVQNVSQARLDTTWVRSRFRDWCGLFVFFDHDRIYLVHQTAKEFLLADTRACDPPSGWKHCLSRSDTEAEMTQICTDLLNFKDVEPVAREVIRRFKELGRIEDCLKQDNEIETLVTYAAAYWPSHFQAAQIAGNDEYVDKLTPFYNSGDDIHRLWFPIYWRATNPYEQQPQINTLQLAALLGHEQKVARILQSTGWHGIDDVDPENNTSLIWASRYGHTQVVQTLLDEGANVSTQGFKHGNALQAALAGGHEQVVQMLLDNGADANAKGGQFGHLLQTASLDGYEQGVQMLLAKGANVNAQGGFYGNALQAASVGGHEQVVQRILYERADVNAQGGFYGNALQAASEGGHRQVVQMLLANGADVNAQGGQYGSALQAASRYSHEQVVQMLLEKGADVNAQGGLYGNAMLAALADRHMRGGVADSHKRVVQMLLDAGANSAGANNLSYG